MKKSLFLGLLIVVSNISAFTYFADNTTSYNVQLKISYDNKTGLCTSADKLVSIPANSVGVKIEDTFCCVKSLKAWRVDKFAPTNIAPEETVPTKKCGTNTFVIYANANGTVSVVD